jgi:hypothetical protein
MSKQHSVITADELIARLKGVVRNPKSKMVISPNADGTYRYFFGCWGAGLQFHPRVTLLSLVEIARKAGLLKAHETVKPGRILH